MKRLETDGEETAEPQSMTTAAKRVRTLHHRGDLISSTQLENARQPNADARRQAIAPHVQRLVDELGMTPDKALQDVVKRWKWEERNNWAQLQRATRCWLPESQDD